MAIGNKLRFEVFKRDGFKCQYCGRSAPDVILNADHINPVSKGGKDEILNLVTSCWECNSGKSNRKLSDNSIVTMQKKQLEELQERRNQIEMMLKWKTAIGNVNLELDAISKHLGDTYDIELTEYGIKDFKKLIKKYPLDKIIDAISLAHERYSEKSDNWIGKVGGILHIQSLPESEQKIMHIKSIVKNFSSYYPTQTDYLLRKYFEVFNDYEAMITHAKNHKHYKHWYNTVVQYYNESKPNNIPALDNW